MEHQDHWTELGRRVHHMGPPQVPGPEIVRQMARICDGARGLTVLLGVTPAYADLGDPLIAFDGSPGMIAAIWPGDTARRQAQLADWTALPLGDGAVRQILGDGSLNSLPDRDDLVRVLSEVRRLLVPEGKAAIRVFVRPDPVEDIPTVLDAARQGRIPSLNALRWRLAAALAEGPQHRVPVARIPEAAAALGDLPAFAEAQGLNPDEARHILAYRDSSASYVFPDRTALADDAARAGLACRWEETTGYPGAELCPIAVLTPIG